MSVNYKRLSAGKRPTRGQVKLLRRDAHGLQTTPAVPAFHFQPTMTIAVTEGGCHLLLERRGVSPRRTAKGDVANRLGAALRYRRNFLTPSATSRRLSSAQRRVHATHHSSTSTTRASAATRAWWRYVVFGPVRFVMVRFSKDKYFDSCFWPLLPLDPSHASFSLSPREGDIPSSLGLVA